MYPDLQLQAANELHDIAVSLSVSQSVSEGARPLACLQPVGQSACLPPSLSASLFVRG